MTDKKTLLIIDLIAYLVMLIVNVLSLAGILNGVTTAEVSDKYTTLFTPGGITFSIWTLIYILLGIYVFRQMFGNGEKYNKTVSLLFLVTCILNVLWIFAWHYMNPLISMIIICLLMVGLWLIVARTNDYSSLTKITFSIYLAWITVATIASIFVFLSSILSFEYDSTFYIVLMFVFFACIAILVLMVGRNRKDMAYILTIVWSVAGILNKHMSITGFNKQYLSIIIGCVALICFCLYQVLMVALIDKA